METRIPFSRPKRRNKLDTESNNSNKNEAPIYIKTGCKSKDVGHYIVHFKATADEEYKELLKWNVEENEKLEQFNSTRGRNSRATEGPGDSSGKKTVCRLERKVKIDIYIPLLTITAIDSKE